MAASKATPTVVHIKSIQKGSTYQKDGYKDLIDRYPNNSKKTANVISSGSGVIISPDGYIVTNNHVIDQGGMLEITLHDNRRFTARKVGNDPGSDLALLKVESFELPYMKFADSEKSMVGDWVLAVGNPFNLASTVTAGIISAKGRNLNILDGDQAIEAFIQTDAAVNQGNSGGALVNAEGDLIGINTAITTTTGAYSGYSFAVPSNLVKKVIDDLLNFGQVQRAILGVDVLALTPELIDQFDVPTVQGVIVRSTALGSAASDAGLRRGDVIISINDFPIISPNAFKKAMALHRPAETITIEYVRAGKILEVSTQLKDQNNKLELTSSVNKELSQILGAEFEAAAPEELAVNLLKSGIKVSAMSNGLLNKYTDIIVGFIITEINNEPIADLDQFYYELNKLQVGDAIIIEGKHVGASKISRYTFGIK
ncbi:UNVERIFIED_CONTAM: hypothetical protein GTU68_021192 [Idotea baltica]|nr:hypothetical protein [Idotea baltica]